MQKKKGKKRTQVDLVESHHRLSFSQRKRKHIIKRSSGVFSKKDKVNKLCGLVNNFKIETFFLFHFLGIPGKEVFLLRIYKYGLFMKTNQNKIVGFEDGRE